MDENIMVSGTSFLINSEGNLLTNAHVVGVRKDMLVSYKGDEFPAKVLAVDHVNDLAVLSTSLKSKKFLKLSINDVAREDNISALGFGFGKRYSSDVKATKGIVSALSGVANNYSHFQTDAAIQVGNSGGPVINDESLVVGVAVAKLNTEAAYKESGTIAENVNFAIKISTVKQFLDSNNISYDLSDGAVLDSKTRNEYIDESVLYIFSKEEDKESAKDVNPCAITSPVAGNLEYLDNVKLEKGDPLLHLFKRDLTGGSIFDLKGDIIDITEDSGLTVWGDDLRQHKLKKPEGSRYFEVIRTLIDFGNIPQRVEKDQPLLVLKPVTDQKRNELKKERDDDYNKYHKKKQREDSLLRWFLVYPIYAIYICGFAFLAYVIIVS